MGYRLHNDPDNKNILYGTGQCVFKGATPGTTCYFKIFPYKGAEEAINYKTDGDIQQITIQIN